MSYRARAFVILGVLCVSQSFVCANSYTPVLVSNEDRPVIVSPDNRWQLSVWGEADEVPWLMLASREVKVRMQKWPIQRYGYVLWGPNSKQFAFTDERYANASYVLIFRVDSKLSCDNLDVTPLLEEHFRRLLGEQYEVLQFYAKATKWLSDAEVLVIVSARTIRESGPETTLSPSGEARDWTRGYVVDAIKQTITREIEEKQLQTEYSEDNAH